MVVCISLQKILLRKFFDAVSNETLILLYLLRMFVLKINDV